MVFKKFIILLLVASMMFSVAACGSKNDKTAKDGKGTETQTEAEGEELIPESNHIVWWWSGDEEDVYINEFVMANPDFTIDNSYATSGPFGDLSIDLPNLAGAMASGETPDLFTGWMTAIEAYYTDMFMPIDSYLEKDKDISIDEFDSQVFELTTFNDRIYFMPFDYSSQILVWNKGKFKNAGLDPEKPPTTWDEFLDYCSKLNETDPTGKLIGLGYYQDHFQWDTWHIISTGEHFVDQTGLNVNINTDSYLEVMEYARKIADTYGGRDKIAGGGGLGWWFLFDNVAIATWSGSGLGWLAQNVSFDFDVARSPVKDENQSEYYSAAVIGAFLGIPRDAKNPTGGWQLMKFVTTEGRINSELKSYQAAPTNYMPEYVIHKPTREKIYESFEPLLTEDLLERFKERDRLIEECNRAYYQCAYHNDFNKFMTENFVKMLDHDLAPKDLLIQAQEYADQLRDEFIKKKEQEGWKFDENGNGIPPSLQE